MYCIYMKLQKAAYKQSVNICNKTIPMNLEFDNK